MRLYPRITLRHNYSNIFTKQLGKLAENISVNVTEGHSKHKILEQRRVGHRRKAQNSQHAKSKVFFS